MCEHITKQRIIPSEKDGMDEDRGWVYVVKISKMGMPSHPQRVKISM